MKKYLMLLSFVFTFIFSGCAGSATSVVQPNFNTNILKSKIVVAKTNEKDTYFFKNNEVSSKSKASLNKIQKDLAETFYFISKFGQSKGYKYFAITNSKLNNLAGFPINSFNNLNNLCAYEYINAKKNYKPRLICWGDSDDSLINYRIRLNARFFRDKVPGIFLYNIDEVISQTKQYL